MWTGASPAPPLPTAAPNGADVKHGPCSAVTGGIVAPTTFRLSSREAELEELRQRGLAKLFNKHFTDTTKRLAAEKAAADAALADLEARKAQQSEFQPNYMNGEMSPLDAMYVSVNQWRNECRRKEKETLLLYQKYVHRFGANMMDSHQSLLPSVPVVPVQRGAASADRWTAAAAATAATTQQQQQQQQDIPSVQVPSMAAAIETSMVENSKQGGVVLPTFETLGADETFHTLHEQEQLAFRNYYRKQLEGRNIDARASKLEALDEERDLAINSYIQASAGLVSPQTTQSQPPVDGQCLQPASPIGKGSTMVPATPATIATTADAGTTDPTSAAAADVRARSYDHVKLSAEPPRDPSNPFGVNGQHQTANGSVVASSAHSYDPNATPQAGSTNRQLQQQQHNGSIDLEPAARARTYDHIKTTAEPPAPTNPFGTDGGSPVSFGKRQPYQHLHDSTSSSDEDDGYGSLYLPPKHDDLDTDSIVSGLTMNSAETRRVMMDCEKSVAMFLREEQHAIRKIMEESDDPDGAIDDMLSGKVATDNRSVKSGTGSQLGDLTVKAADQAETMVKQMEDILKNFQAKHKGEGKDGDGADGADGDGDGNKEKKREPRPYETSNPDEKWMIHYDEVYDREYYHEVNTNRSQWEAPDAADLSIPTTDTASTSTAKQKQKQHSSSRELNLSYDDVMPDPMNDSASIGSTSIRSSRLAVYRRKRRKLRKRRIIMTIAGLTIVALCGGGYYYVYYYDDGKAALTNPFVTMFMSSDNNTIATTSTRSENAEEFEGARQRRIRIDQEEEFLLYQQQKKEAEEKEAALAAAAAAAVAQAEAEEAARLEQETEIQRLLRGEDVVVEGIEDSVECKAGVSKGSSSTTCLHKDAIDEVGSESNNDDSGHSEAMAIQSLDEQRRWICRIPFSYLIHGHCRRRAREKPIFDLHSLMEFMFQ